MWMNRMTMWKWSRETTLSSLYKQHQKIFMNEMFRFAFHTYTNIQRRHHHQHHHHHNHHTMLHNARWMAKLLLQRENSHCASTVNWNETWTAYIRSYVHIILCICRDKRTSEQTRRQRKSIESLFVLAVFIQNNQRLDWKYTQSKTKTKTRFMFQFLQTLICIRSNRICWKV